MRPLIPCSMVVFCLQAITSASEVGFRFTGVVVQPAAVLGVGPFEPFSPVIGRFVYETAVSKTHVVGDGDSAGYRQRIFGGLSMTISNVTFRADDYLAAVFNDDPMNSGADIFNVIFSSGLNPPPEKPLLVGLAPHTTGVFSVVFKDSSGTVFSDSSLPLDLPPSTFLANSKFAFLRDSPTNPSNEVVILISSFSRLHAVAGDYDFDDDVDGADLLLWQRNYGSTTELAADGNRNEVVDAGDLSVWTDHFGDAPPPVVSIPEPSTSLLLLVMGITVSMKRMQLNCY